MSDTQEQPLKEGNVKDISNSHGKKGHLNVIDIVEKNSGQLKKLGDGLADGECQVFRASFENVVQQRVEHQKNDLKRLENVAQGTNPEHGFLKDDKAKSIHVLWRVLM